MGRAPARRRAGRARPRQAADARRGIQGAKRRGRPWRTTRPDPDARRRPDLVRRDFTAPAPDRLWVADLSYLRCWEGLVFFSFVLDAYSRRVVGWQQADHMRTTLVLDALRMALATRRPGADVQLVHHSDRGNQGGFNRSSQRSLERGCDGREETGGGSGWSAGDALAGRPPVGRLEHRQRVWAAIARGVSSEDPAAEAGVSAAVGVRWFREGGGMPSVTLAAPSGRYLSFAEREEIAILRSCGAGVREIARQLGRAPASISRELRRNAATRSGGFEYRATTAQWHADLRARRPKPAKLAVNTELCRYVQDRLYGAVRRPDGVAGPEVRWIGRRHGRRADRRWARSWSPEQISNRLCFSPMMNRCAVP
jgi:Helix-turn-helix domain/Integrase core domain